MSYRRKDLLIVSIPDLELHAAAKALLQAIERVAATEPAFEDRLMDHRIAYIVDSPPGTITLPKDDAEKLAEAARQLGYRVELNPPPPPSTPEQRNRARAAYLAYLRGSGPTKEKK